MRRLIAHASFAACTLIGGFVTMFVYVFGAAALQRSLPVLYSAWHDRPDLRWFVAGYTLLLIGVALGVATGAGVLTVRALQRQRIVEPTTVSWPTWFVDSLKLGVVLWPLFGVATACFILTPGLFRLLGYPVPSLFSNVHDLLIPFWVFVVLGAVVGVPAGAFWGIQFAKRINSNE